MAEPIKVAYSNPNSVEEFILHQLIDGPSDPAYHGVLNPETGINRVEMRDKICFVDFDEAFLENPYEVQKDEYFVLGDNVNTSEDSRYGNLGAIKEDYIIGQVYFKFSDENHNMGLVK